MKKIRLFVGLLLGMTMLLLAAGCQQPEEQLAAKPVIYLYPQQETQVEVRLTLDGALTASYPDYGDGWRVVVQPDGTLTDPDTGRDYCPVLGGYLPGGTHDLYSGFVVPGADTADFLEETLATLGLTQREADEFIIYWLPRMAAIPIISSPSRPRPTPTLRRWR